MSSELKDFERNLARMELLIRFATEYSREHKEDLTRAIEKWPAPGKIALDIRNYKGLARELLEAVLTTGIVFLKAATESYSKSIHKGYDGNGNVVGHDADGNDIVRKCPQFVLMCPPYAPDKQSVHVLEIVKDFRDYVVHPLWEFKRGAYNKIECELPPLVALGSGVITHYMEDHRLMVLGGTKNRYRLLMNEIHARPEYPKISSRTYLEVLIGEVESCIREYDRQIDGFGQEEQYLPIQYAAGVDDESPTDIGA